MEEKDRYIRIIKEHIDEIADKLKDKNDIEIKTTRDGIAILAVKKEKIS